MKHLHVRFHEKDDNSCTICGTKTILIFPVSEWDVDENAHEELPDRVYVSDEITAHYCNKCEKVTSLSFNESV